MFKNFPQFVVIHTVKGFGIVKTKVFIFLELSCFFYDPTDVGNLISHSFSCLEPVCCSMSSSNCCFFTCMQVSQEADQVVWYSQIFQNFPQSIVIHTVKGFGIVSKAELDVFLELSCFFHDPADVGNLISGSSAFSKTSLNIWKFTAHVLLKPDLGIIYLIIPPQKPLEKGGFSIPNLKL